MAFEKGGAKDYIKDGENGIFFKDQSVKSLEQAVEKFEKMNFDAKKISKSAEKFSTENFKCDFENFVREKIDEKFGE